MSDYLVKYLDRFKGGGLIDNDPLVTTATDVSGNPYLVSDYVGSYLLPVKLKDLATFMRVKKWKVTATCDVSLGAFSTTFTSSTITTPDTVYELARCFYSENDPNPNNDADWTFASLYEVPSERYHELERGRGGAKSRPFRMLSIDGDIALYTGWGVSVSVGKGYESFDYYRKNSNFSTLEDGINVNPNDEIYLPVSVTFGYGDDSYALGQSISMSAYTKISASYLDWDRTQLNKFTNAFRLKFLGVDVRTDMYWGEPTGEGITLDDLDIQMEAVEYWTYGGKFLYDSGKPA